MQIQRAAPVNELLAKLLFLVLPTAVIGYFLLHSANEYYAILQNKAPRQSLYLLGGMAAGAVFYAFRFRFLPAFALLLFLLYSGGKGIGLLANGEFDSFFLEAQYWVFSILFSLGWVFGWGFVRLRYFSIIVAALLLTACIPLIAKQKTASVEDFLWAFAPAVLYAVYIVYAAEQIYSYRDKSQKYWWFLTRRVGAFAALALLILGTTIWLNRDSIKSAVAEFGGGGKAGDKSMLKKDGKNRFDLKDYSRLSSSLGRDNELLFIAHIDNYFEGTDVPNPLYLTAFYYTRFDTATETFERDSVIPRNDLFEPDPAAIPLFKTRTDSSVIRQSGTEQLGKTVGIEVYSRKLSFNTYLAPHTGYFVQPITVDKDFRDSFQFAYRAKSYVSKLNSAYFVYNATQKEIRDFQESRFEVLRRVRAADYAPEDRRFMNYYTYMPRDAKWNRISELARKVTANAGTPVDQVIAIRDYFLSRDASGQPLFKYTDNPGVPGLPDASKLQYFLFESHQGYCAYYAGATLFMLRALGIPSRIAVGFLTQDRSGGKNPGWYWYYADQAHAWVQVYFPGYGWLDFDTTVGNSEAQESPKPDGTPPAQPPVAFYSTSGVIESVDTASKRMRMRVASVLFKDKEYTIPGGAAIEMDVHIATFRRDSVEVPFANVVKGDSATAVSYADAFRNLAVREGEAGSALMARSPKPQPIDEVYLSRKEAKKQKETPPVVAKKKPFDWKAFLVGSAIAVVVLALLFLLLPRFVAGYYAWRRRSSRGKPQEAYWTYRSVDFYLHQMGEFRGARTPMQYAREQIDPVYGTSLTRFMNMYLKQKYAGQQLTAGEQSQVSAFYAPFAAAVKTKIPAGTRAARLTNPFRTLAWFFQRKDAEQA